jgi:phage gp29-like protein
MALVDQYGKEIKSGKPILEKIAVQTVRDRYSSYPSQGLTAERLATILKEADQGYVFRQAELFEEMEEKDGHLASELQKRKLAVAGLEWEVQPASESAEDKKIALAAKEMLGYIGSSLDADEDLDGFDGALTDIMDAVGKGFSCGEIVWDMSEGQVWVDSINYCHPKKFTFNGRPENQTGVVTAGLGRLLGYPRLITDAEPVWGEELPPNKFVFFRHKARSGATSRGGLLRPCAYLYLFKNYDIKDWLVFNELFSVPMRVGKYKPGATTDEIEKLKQAVFNLGVDAAAVVSESTVIELLESAQRTQSSGFKDLAEFCEKTQTKVILGHTGSSEGTPGKLGSEDQAKELRQDLKKADAKALERCVRLRLLGPWTMFNYGPDAAVPNFKLQYEQGEDLEKTSKVYAALVRDMGYDQIPVSHVQEKFNLPAPKEGEPTVKPPQPANPFGNMTAEDAEGNDKKAMQQNRRCACGQIHKSAIRAQHPALDLQLHADQDWIVEYLRRIEPALKGAKKSALDEIGRWLAEQAEPPSQAEFTAKIQEILGAAYGKIDQAAVRDAVADMYRYYKTSLPAGSAVVSFGGADARSVAFLADVDRMFFSKFVKNPEAEAAITDFLNERYLKGGEGLFGRGNPETIAELKDLLSQKMTDVSGSQVNRIVDTSVQRIRNWAHISRLSDAAVPEVEVYEPTQDCPFCVAVHGKVVRVEAAAAKMSEYRDMDPADYAEHLKQNPALSENVLDFVARGELPPYHPHCHGRVIVRTK